jgi:hypothetical protein
MVSPKNRAVVWARGAGRCYYCNASLIGDYISGNEDANFGFVAHIVAEIPKGPRGDPIRSPQLADDVGNLILMCYPHHKLIDVDEVADYSEQRLLDMKIAHEDRIRIVTDITRERASHVLRYGAKIGMNESPISFSAVRLAMLPERYPVDGRSIGIEIVGSAATDGEDIFWRTEPDNLRRQFERMIRERIATREITYLSVFALGPMPLLIELGRLLSDIVPADIYQLHREPSGWNWASNGPRIEYEIIKSTRNGGKVALKLGISADVTDDRIMAVLGDGASIWSLTAKVPGNDVMRYPEDLQEFRRLMRGLYNEIKAVHGEGTTIHMFPAVPVSVAVEIGRVRMPKADLPVLVYDQLPGAGFKPRLEIR